MTPRRASISSARHCSIEIADGQLAGRVRAIIAHRRLGWMSLCLRGMLFFLSVVAVSCTVGQRQCSRDPAFFHAHEGPMFSALRSDSAALSRGSSWLDVCMAD